MKKYNLSLIIPIYKRHKNIYELLRWAELNGIEFNDIFLVFDKIDDIGNANDIVDICRFKNLLSKMRGITLIQNEKHLGKIGMADLGKVPIKDEENTIILEDEFDNRSDFLDQCETFFNSLYSDTLPIFIGYSKTNIRTSEFFETYNFLHMWGMASKASYLRKLCEEQKRMREYNEEEKRSIIDDILSYSFPSEPFEKYKKELIDLTEVYLFNRPDSIDIFFMYYLLKNRIKILKHSQCHAKLLGSPFKEHENPTIIDNVEMDLLNTVNWCKQIREGKKLRNLRF